MFMADLPIKILSFIKKEIKKENLKLLQNQNRTEHHEACLVFV